MTFITHVAAAAIGTATYYISNKFLNNNNNAIIKDNNDFLNLFSGAISEHELGKAYGMDKIFSVLDNGRKDIQDPRSDLGREQIHKLCTDNFGEDLCDNYTEAFMITNCDNFNNIEQAFSNNNLFSFIAGAGMACVIEQLLG
jgi:hypothetical protein